MKRPDPDRVPTPAEIEEHERTIQEAQDEYVRQLALIGARSAAARKARGPHFARQTFRGVGSLGGVPSDTLAVHPKQVEEAIQFCKDRGVPTDYTPGGRPIIRSAAHQKAHGLIRGGYRPKRGYG